MAQWREFLTTHRVPSSDYGWTKTQTALAILSGQAHRCVAPDPEPADGAAVGRVRSE
jgi:hypothetical protein